MNKEFLMALFRNVKEEDWELCQNDKERKKLLRHAYEEAKVWDYFGNITAFINLKNGKHMKEKFIVLCGIANGIPEDQIPHYDDDIVRDDRDPNCRYTF